MAENEVLINSVEDNAIRPYNVGVTEHDKTLATIVLYRSKDSLISDSSDNIDYLNSFEIPIPTISSETVPQDGNVRQRVGTMLEIPKLKNFGGPDNNYYGIFNNFSLLKVSEIQSQNVKVHQNFSNVWNAFFFGDKPEIYSFNGFFLDTREYPYYQEFLMAYEEYLSGRKCVENQMELKVVYDGRIVDGYMLNISTINAAGDPFMKNFSFSVLVKSTSWLRNNLVVKRAIQGLSDDHMRVSELNGFSNEYRLAKQFDTGELDSLETD